MDIVSLQSRLKKDIDKAKKDINILSGRLKNPNFTTKAPKEVIDECKNKLQDASIQAKLAEKRLADLL